MNKDTMYYNDLTYTCYDGKYYRGFKDGKIRILNRDVWIAHYGAIPKGYDIHHKDENKYNNDISNLQCITRSEHTKLHHKLGSISHTSSNGVKLDALARNRIWKKLHPKTREQQDKQNEYNRQYRLRKAGAQS